MSSTEHALYSETCLNKDHLYIKAKIFDHSIHDFIKATLKGGLIKQVSLYDVICINTSDHTLCILRLHNFLLIFVCKVTFTSKILRIVHYLLKCISMNHSQYDIVIKRSMSQP